MKDPRNNPDKWLRPDEPPTQEELAKAMEILVVNAVKALRRIEYDKACAEYDYLTGTR